LLKVPAGIAFKPFLQKSRRPECAMPNNCI
jgi:hypothetical protein